MSHSACIIIPSFKAADVLPKTVERIPATFFENGGKAVIVNDASPDDTGKVADQLAEQYPHVSALHHPQNRGYGGAQKSGLHWGLEKGCDSFAIVHADGQYAPELVEELLTPIWKGEAHIVQGSRMLGSGALKGGMPLSRYLPNRALTLLENLAFGTSMKEFHSGYMLYSRKLLEALPFDALQNNFNFDAEIILVAHLAGFPCAQLPIPTCYSDESSSLDPIPYGINVLKMIFVHFGGHYRALLKKSS
ncbi:MAG: glycosyltransferase family 2 protein [Chthoniobacterales bacterium]